MFYLIDYKDNLKSKFVVLYKLKFTQKECKNLWKMFCLNHVIK